MATRVKPMKKGTAEYLTYDGDREACIIAVRDAEGTPPYPLARRVQASGAMLSVLRAFVAGGTHHGPEFFHSEVTNDVMSEARRLVRELDTP